MMENGLYTVDEERFAGLKVRGFNPAEVFAEIFLRYLGACVHGKTFAVLLKTVKTRKFSPANLSPFAVLEMRSTHVCSYCI